LDGRIFVLSNEINRASKFETMISTPSYFDHYFKIESAYKDGNDFHFDAAQHGCNPDQNIEAVLLFSVEKYNLSERIGSTNGGASYSSISIKNAITGELVYSDSFHDGRGAWQTGDSDDARCEYTELTLHIIRRIEDFISNQAVTE